MHPLERVLRFYLDKLRANSATSNKHRGNAMISNQFGSKVFIPLICLLLATSGGVAKANPQYVGGPITWKWAKENWSGDDKPYTKVRKEVGALYGTRKLNDAELNRYKQASFADPENALLRFKWAYYAYCLALLQPDISIGSGKLAGVSQAFRFNKSPGSYQYTRLRFLVLSYLTNSGPELRALGTCLLKRDSKDVPVKYRQVTHLSGGSSTEAALGLKYAQELVQTQPNEPAMYALLAFAYQNRWWGTHSESDANAAIANYKRYMSMANLVGAKRKDVEKTISYLQSK